MFIKSLPNCKYVNPLQRSYLKFPIHVGIDERVNSNLNKLNIIFVCLCSVLPDAGWAGKLRVQADHRGHLRIWLLTKTVSLGLLVC